MKRISDFEDCRMDMKNMAALSGGAPATSFSTSQPTKETPDYPCGDTMTTTNTDDYFTHPITGGRVLYYYDPKNVLSPYPCDNGLSTTINYATEIAISPTSFVASGRSAGLIKLS